MQMASCYVLSTDVRPGGCQESTRAVFNSWAAVEDALIDEFCDPMAVYLTAVYGRKIEVQRVEDGIVTMTLYPKDHMVFEVLGDLRTVRFDVCDGYEPLVSDDDDDLADALFDSDVFGVRDGRRVTHPLYTLRFESFFTQ